MSLTLILIGIFAVSGDAARRKHDVQFLTYNTALVDFPLIPTVIPNNRIERRDAIIGAISSVGADLVCLQEVWIGQDVEEIVNGLSSEFPFSYSVIHNDNGTLPPQATGIQEPACNRTLLAPYRDCYTSNNCSSPFPATAINCALDNCRPEFDALLTGPNARKCISCLVVNYFSSIEEQFNMKVKYATPSECS